MYTIEKKVTRKKTNRSIVQCILYKNSYTKRKKQTEASCGVHSRKKVTKQKHRAVFYIEKNEKKKEKKTKQTDASLSVLYRKMLK